MNGWIKLDNLPDYFWGECFIGYHTLENPIVHEDVGMVKKGADGVVKWHSRILNDWFEFRNDVEYLVMPLKYPQITKEDFK